MPPQASDSAKGQAPSCQLRSFPLGLKFKSAIFFFQFSTSLEPGDAHVVCGFSAALVFL